MHLLHLATENLTPAKVLTCARFFSHHLSHMLSAGVLYAGAVPFSTLVCVRAIISFSKVEVLIPGA